MLFVTKFNAFAISQTGEFIKIPINSPVVKIKKYDIGITQIIYKDKILLVLSISLKEI